MKNKWIAAIVLTYSAVVFVLAACGKGNEVKEAPARAPLMWAEVQEKVIKPRCTGCHYPGNRDRISDFTDLKTFRATAGPALYLTMVKGAMPPAPNEFPRDEKLLLATWIIDGMK